jgi:hypothetical protein
MASNFSPLNPSNVREPHKIQIPPTFYQENFGMGSLLQSLSQSTLFSICKIQSNFYPSGNF